MNQREVHWYLVYTKPRQEGVVVENLQRQGYLVYLPEVLCVRRGARQGKERYEPMFPRYCFFRPHSAEHSIAPVRSTVGVSQLVRFGSSLASLSDSVVEEIRGLAALQKARRSADAAPFEVKQCVTLRQGPLAGIGGVVSEVSAERIVVLLHLLGRETRVSVAAKWVSAA